MRHSWAVLLISAATLPILLGIGGAGVAQQSDSQPRSVDDGPPPGGCTPIGLTVSGEIVFPMTCKDFIERHKAADRAATAADAKPATTEAAKAPEAAKTPEAAKSPATTAAGKAPPAVEADKAQTTGEANRAAADVTPAAVEPSKAPMSVDSGKDGEKDTKAAIARSSTDDAAEPAAREAAVTSERSDSAKPSVEPATTSALDKRSRARNRVAGGPDCTRYRTYDAASRSYRDFGGRRRPCP